MRFPRIDYEIHPAYAPYRSGVSHDEDFIEQEISAIDALYQEFCVLPAPSDANAEETARHIGRLAGEILGREGATGVSVVAREWLDICFAWAIGDIRYELSRRVSAIRERRTLRVAKSEEVDSLREKGMYLSPLPPSDYGEIRRLVLGQRDDLKARAESDPYSRSVMNVQYMSPLWRAIKSAVTKSGVMDSLGEFEGNRMSMLGAGVEYSHEAQRWHQGLYTDQAVPDSTFKYLHFDEGYCLPKAMIYITPVDLQSGPTRVIPGSNRWEESEFRLRVFRALDRVVSDRYGRFSGAGTYRPIARLPDLRRIFMELPRAFRGSSHFGDDVTDGNPVAGVLRAGEVPYLSKEVPQALIFNGPRVLHRGGVVDRGERMAIQVVFRNRNEAAVKARLAKETFLTDQVSLLRKYARKFIMSHM